MTATILEYQKPADLAAGRNRKRALGVIVPRLQKLRRVAEPVKLGRFDGYHAVTKDGLSIIFYECRDGTNFQVSNPGVPGVLMSGWLYRSDFVLNQNRPTTADVSVMSWKRGWERSLFH